MSNFEKGLKYGGYDTEEAYFHKLNQELISKIKGQRNEGEGEEAPGAKIIPLSSARKKSESAMPHKKAA